MPRKSPQVIAPDNFRTQAIVRSKQTRLKQSVKNYRKKQKVSNESWYGPKSELTPKRANQNRPISTKERGSYKAEAQKMRVKTMHVSGSSIRAIARKEKIARETVTRIINEPDVKQFVEELRAKWYGLGNLALEAEKYRLEVKKDGWLGHKVLECMGVVPPKQSQVRTETSSYTPEQNYSREALNILLEGHEYLGVGSQEIEKALAKDSRECMEDVKRLKQNCGPANQHLDEQSPGDRFVGNSSQSSEMAFFTRFTV
jgi:transposase-like protein